MHQGDPAIMETNDVSVSGRARESLPLDAGRQYSAVQLFFLRRLQALAEIAGSDAVAEGWQGKLLAKALYSTYIDCRTLNVDTEARALLDGQETKL